MIEKNIILNKFEDIKRFVDITMQQPFDVDLVSGKYVINAKSLIGVFSMDLSRPILMRADCDENAQFLVDIEDLSQ